MANNISVLDGKLIRIMIVDDHGIVRDSLKRICNTVEEFEVVGTAEDGEEAVVKAIDLQPDIILMDISMPKCSGIEATRRIKEINSKIKVLILTTFSNNTMIRDAFFAEVDGYIMKDTTSVKLIGCIKDAVKGDVIIPASIARKLVRMVQEENQHQLPSFNETEKNIVNLLVEGRSNKEIASVLEISYGTVRNYISDIYNEIGETTRIKAITKLKSQYNYNCES